MKKTRQSATYIRYSTHFRLKYAWEYENFRLKIFATEPFFLNVFPSKRKKIIKTRGKLTLTVSIAFSTSF